MPSFRVYSPDKLDAPCSARHRNLQDTASEVIKFATGDVLRKPQEIRLHSRGDVHQIFMKAGHAGRWTAVGFPFLHVAFAISGSDDEGVIACGRRQPLRLPKRPCKGAAGVIDLDVPPGLAVLDTKNAPRNSQGQLCGPGNRADAARAHRSFRKQLAWSAPLLSPAELCRCNCPRPRDERVQLEKAVLQIRANRAVLRLSKLRC